jgi:hypothetical protein
MTDLSRPEETTASLSNAKELRPRRQREAIVFRSLTRQPQLLVGGRTVPLGNQHVVPILLFLHSRGASGATVADIGRELFPDLRHEALRNKVKNARVHLRSALATFNSFGSAGNLPRIGFEPLKIESVGHSRSTRLRLETGGRRVHWDLEVLERALDRGGANWLRLLPTYMGEFLAGYGLEVEDGWVQRTRLRLKTRLLECATGLMTDWQAQGWNRPVRGLAARLLECDLLDPEHPLTEFIAILEVQAVEAMSGRAAALAVWVAHDERFRAAFIEALALARADPRTRN